MAVHKLSAYIWYMKIVSYNVNGIRAAIKKGFLDWLKTNPADVICIQEAKASQNDIDVAMINELGYYDHWFCAEKKGYSGVTVLTKSKPLHVVCGTGHRISDSEGRVMHVDFEGVRIVNAYFPSGTTGQERQQYKYQWLNEFYDYIQEMRLTQPNMVVCGDYNIAHKEIDIHNPKGNKNTSGFLPEERLWMDRLFSNGWVDTFRHFNKEPHCYSWWSQRFPSVRRENKGWRIDYIAATNCMQPLLKNAGIYPAVQHSDHCPVYLEIADAKQQGKLEISNI